MYIKERKTLKISEFLQGRSVARQAVTRYINRHDEIFKNHVKKDGKELDLDMVAIEALEKAYPLEMPVNVINGVPKESFIKIQNEFYTITNLQGSQTSNKIITEPNISVNMRKPPSNV